MERLSTPSSVSRDSRWDRMFDAIESRRWNSSKRRVPKKHFLVFVRAHVGADPLRMTNCGGFVTGDTGIGHVAVTTNKPFQMRGYYDTVFDARLTDYIDETISGVKFKIRFLRVNERHHSLAIAAMNSLRLNPIRTRVQHLNIQVAGLDDMTASYQRIRELGIDMALDVGRQGTLLLRADAVGIRMGGRVEPDRRRREHLGALHPSGHQHLGAHGCRTDHRR